MQQAMQRSASIAIEHLEGSISAHMREQHEVRHPIMQLTKASSRVMPYLKTLSRRLSTTKQPPARQQSLAQESPGSHTDAAQICSLHDISQQADRQATTPQSMRDRQEGSSQTICMMLGQPSRSPIIPQQDMVQQRRGTTTSFI